MAASMAASSRAKPLGRPGMAYMDSAVGTAQPESSMANISAGTSLLNFRTLFNQVIIAYSNRKGKLFHHDIFVSQQPLQF